MEESNSEGSGKQASGDEAGNQRDEEPTTSTAENTAERNSHNMNDLKALDFNSADEVRQAMKAILNGQLPPPPFAEEANQARMNLGNKSEPVVITELQNKPHAHDLRNTVQRRVQQNLYLKMKSTVNIPTGNSLKRRGKPMKAGPSRSAKATSARKSLFYIGKLSNVVQFKHRWTSESGSDGDSIVYYY